MGKSRADTAKIEQALQSRSTRALLSRLFRVPTLHASVEWGVGGKQAVLFYYDHPGPITSQESTTLLCAHVSQAY